MDSNRMAWLAGLIDADGCIGLYSSGNVGHLKNGTEKRIVPKVTITLTCRKTRERVQEVIGEMGVGCHVNVHRVPPEKNWANRWDVEVAGMKRVAALLPQLLPHFVTKEEEAKIAIEFITSRFTALPKTPYTAIERNLVARCRALKRNRNNT